MILSPNPLEGGGTVGGTLVGSNGSVIGRGSFVVSPSATCCCFSNRHELSCANALFVVVVIIITSKISIFFIFLVFLCVPRACRLTFPRLLSVACVSRLNITNIQIRLELTAFFRKKKPSPSHCSKRVLGVRFFSFWL